MIASKHVEVRESWYPSYVLEGFSGEHGFVCVRMSGSDRTKEWYVSVSGEDDCGCTYYGIKSKDAAFRIFNKVVPGITQAELKKLGFEFW